MIVALRLTLGLDTLVTVTVVVPKATPVTNPLELTVAIAVLLDDQVTFLLLAVEGTIVATNW